MKREIGSEFSKESRIKSAHHNLFSNKCILTFSGRTSIDLVLQNESNIKSILMPSYCCQSMLEPFVRRGITIYFYVVSLDCDSHFKIDFPKVIEQDAIFLCNYFGYHVDYQNIKELYNFKGIIIEDITHSLLSSKVFNEFSDYLIGSLRKWGALKSGGILIPRKGKKIHDSIKMIDPDSKFLKMKEDAMAIKEKFLNFETDNKESYLELFAKCNNKLSKKYVNIRMDSDSIRYLEYSNFKIWKQKRLENALFLYNGLNNVKSIKFLFDKQSMDCPLFVPIIVQKNRDKLIKLLIDNNIYCPRHWPQPMDNCVSKLYDTEISLVVDQRYDIEDMKKIIDIIKLFDKKETTYE